MADVISAEEGALRKGGQAVAEARAAITKSAGDVRSEVAATSSWKGAAADDFHRLMDSWDTKAENLLKVLDHLEEALGGTDKDLAAGEEEHSTTLSNLGSAMSGI